MADIRFVVGSGLPDRVILRALTLAGWNTNRAINILLDTPMLLAADDPLPFESCDDGFPGAARAHFTPYLNPRPISALRPDIAYRRLQSFSAPETAELEELPVDPVWFLVAKTCVAGLSTCRGKKQLDADEIDHFSFPSFEKINTIGRRWLGSKTEAAVSQIVRFSTKRGGEVRWIIALTPFMFPFQLLNSSNDFMDVYLGIKSSHDCQIGRFKPEWSKCLIPLVGSSIVMIRGRCVFSTVQLSLMQEITLNVRWMWTLLCWLISYVRWNQPFSFSFLQVA